MAFFPDDDTADIPHDQSVDWLRQYSRPDGAGYALARGYLVVTASPGSEQPLEIWESVGIHPVERIDMLYSLYQLVWKDPDADE